MRIVVTGLVGMLPIGGVAWDYLQYVIGLRRLGHDVFYFEDTWTWPYSPVENRYVETGDYSARYLDAFFRRYAPDLADRWHYLHLGETGFGLSRPKMDEVLATADLFLNVSGANRLPENLPASCRKVFLDTDPGYNQIALSERPAWLENGDRWAAGVAAHDLFFTYAENIDAADCGVPRLDRKWSTTRMPVVIDLWDAVAARPAVGGAPWATVMTWSAFKGPLRYRGVEYHSKGPEFERLLDLPTRTTVPLKVAVGGKAPLERLRTSGWNVASGPEVTVTPADYVEFIAQTRGEISTAKNVYVALRTGWFSCRSACFLAAGRPVVVQDTGFRELLPADAGLLTFTNVEEAADAIARVEADYATHARAARDVASCYFDHATVLRDLLKKTGV